MRKFLALAALATLFLTGQSKAQVLVVDEFTEGPQSLALSSPGTVSNTFSSGQTADFIGGDRELELTLASGFSAAAEVNTADGEFQVSFGALSEGSATLTYISDSVYDLTTDPGLPASFLSIIITADLSDNSNLSTANFLSVTLTDDDGDFGTVGPTVISPTTSPFLVDVSDFFLASGGTLDFDAIKSIGVSFTGGPSFDTTIENLTISRTTIPPVPVPSAFILAGIGAVGLIGYRQRKLK